MKILTAHSEMNCRSLQRSNRIGVGAGLAPGQTESIQTRAGASPTPAFFVALFFSVSFFSCIHQAEEITPPISSPQIYTGECNPDSVYFENHIMPILATRCGISSCHDDETQQSDLIMMDHTSLLNSNIIIPGDSLGSLMYQVINGIGDVSMPPDGEMTLTANQKQQIAKWISQGAINNVCTEVCDTTDVSFSQDIEPIIQDRCQWCHGEGPNVAGNFLLVGYNHISNAALDGEIMNAVLGQNGFEPMPSVGPPLTDCQILLLQLWIEDGAPDN